MPCTTVSALPPLLHVLRTQVSGLNCVIVVSRFTTRWVLSAIFPVMATTWLGFLVFFLPKDDMNGRAGALLLLLLVLWLDGRHLQHELQREVL
jgi:hypothetical protein